MPSTSGAVEASLTFVVLGRELGVALYPKDGTPSLSLHLDHPVTASAPLAPFFARSALPRKRVRSLTLKRHPANHPITSSARIRRAGGVVRLPVNARVRSGTWPSLSRTVGTPSSSPPRTPDRDGRKQMADRDRIRDPAGSLHRPTGQQSRPRRPARS